MKESVANLPAILDRRRGAWRNSDREAGLRGRTSEEEAERARLRSSTREVPPSALFVRGYQIAREHNLFGEGALKDQKGNELKVMQRIRDGEDLNPELVLMTDLAPKRLASYVQKSHFDQNRPVVRPGESTVQFKTVQVMAKDVKKADEFYKLRAKTTDAATIESATNPVDKREKLFIVDDLVVELTYLRDHYANELEGAVDIPTAKTDFPLRPQLCKLLSRARLELERREVDYERAHHLAHGSTSHAKGKGRAKINLSSWPVVEKVDRVAHPFISFTPALIEAYSERGGDYQLLVQATPARADRAEDVGGPSSPGQEGQRGSARDRMAMHLRRVRAHQEESDEARSDADEEMMMGDRKGVAPEKSEDEAAAAGGSSAELTDEELAPGTDLSKHVVEVVMNALDALEDDGMGKQILLDDVLPSMDDIDSETASRILTFMEQVTIFGHDDAEGTTTRHRIMFRDGTIYEL